MRLVFMGTPDFAVPCLESLIESRHEILAVVTQPDRPRNRGEVTFCPVKECAVKHNIKVLQYERVSREGIEDIRALNPDAIITVAFGQMLSQEFLDIPKYGVINVHASLLPKYRGSSPIQWAVINGEKETGITIMKTAYKMDSGDIILQERTDILENETAGELFDRLSNLSAPVLLKALDSIESGTAEYISQNEDEMTYFPMLKKEDGNIDFNMTAQEIKCRVLGFTPWPSAFTKFRGKMIKILRVETADVSGNAGEVVEVTKDDFTIATKEGGIKVLMLQPENSKKMSTHDYLLGHKINVGDKF